MSAGGLKSCSHSGSAALCRLTAVGSLPQALWLMLLGWIAGRRARTWLDPTGE